MTGTGMPHRSLAHTALVIAPAQLENKHMLRYTIDQWLGTNCFTSLAFCHGRFYIAEVDESVKTPCYSKVE